MIHFNMPVCPSTCNNMAPLEGFLSHLITEYFSKHCFEIQLALQSDMSTLHEDPYIFMTVSK
jgi:hypothetical protein